MAKIGTRQALSHSGWTGPEELIFSLDTGIRDGSYFLHVMRVCGFSACVIWMLGAHV